MKRYSLILPFFLIVTQLVIAQENPKVRKLTFKVTINDSTRQLDGYLVDISDTTLKVSNWPIRFRKETAIPENFKEVGYSAITKMTIKRRHGVHQGAWKGAVAGVLIGVVAGFVEGDDPSEMWFGLSASDKAVIYGGIGAGVGAGIGALIGALARKTFIIGGKKQRFDEMKTNVLNKAYGLKNLPENSRQ